MSNLSSSLSAESKKYVKGATGLARSAALRKWVPTLVVAVVVLFALFVWRRFMS